MHNAQRVLFVCKIISKFVVRSGYILGGHIESVFAVLNRKCGSFQNERMTNSTHFLYMYGSIGTFCVDASRITGVGHCIVYFHSGLSTTLYSINGNHLHTFLFYYQSLIGDVTANY